jgi:hypothetical protein
MRDLRKLDEMESADRDAWRSERLQVLGTKLFRLAQDQVGKRASIEQRWLEDLRQYNGLYDPTTESRLRANKESRIFANVTRAKTNQAEARLYDMLFPTDDRNWGLTPTPVPELQRAIGDARQVPDPATGQPAVTPDGQPVTVGAVAQTLLDEAKQRAEAMQEEIDDQLTEALYSTKCRDLIHDACVYGTGVIKAPVVVGRERRSWLKEVDPATGETVHVLDVVNEPRPGVEHVAVWDFFPDMSATKVEDAEFFFERGYKTRRDVRQLVHSPHYLEDQIRLLVAEDARHTQVASDHLNKLREISGIDAQMDDNRYEIWKYAGPIDKEDLVACGCELTEEQLDDPLTELYGVVEFAGTRVIKAHLNPMDTNEMVYSVFCYEKDDTSIFGFGVPYMLRNPQRVINAAWRMILDNGGLAVGPQIVVNRNLVRPADGDWNIRGRKVWEMEDKMRSVAEVFGMYEISSHQEELANIFTMARQLADEEPSLPMIAQGEQGMHTTRTAHGMSILMNSANVVLRRAVKNFDDDVTTPVIRRFYDWNMQYSDKEQIKGDYEVDARGSSVLLVKEMQAQNLMVLATNFAAHPVFGPMTKAPDLYRKVVQAHHIAADDVVLSDEDIAAVQQQMQQAQAQGAAPQGPDPLAVEQARHEGKLKELQFERETKLQLAQIDREIQLIKLAEAGKLTLAQLETKLAEKAMGVRADREAQEREIEVKTRWGSGL